MDARPSPVTKVVEMRLLLTPYLGIEIPRQCESIWAGNGVRGRVCDLGFFFLSNPIRNPWKKKTYILQEHRFSWFHVTHG